MLGAGIGGFAGAGIGNVIGSSMDMAGLMLPGAGLNALKGAGIGGLAGAGIGAGIGIYKSMFGGDISEKEKEQREIIRRTIPDREKAEKEIERRRQSWFGSGGHVDRAAGAVGGALPLMARAIGPDFQSMNQALKEMQGPLGPVVFGFKGLASGLEGVSSIVKQIPIVSSLLGPLSEYLAAMPGTLQEMTIALTGMAEKASPSQFKMWQLALDDTQAVIGQSFLPVLELMREGVRLFGDVLANILPSTGEVREAMSGLRVAFAEAAAEIRRVFAEIGPTIRDMLVEKIKTLAHWAAVGAKAVAILADKLRMFFGDMGWSKPGESGRSSVGASAQPANIGGLDEYQRKLQLAAFSQPGGLSDAEKQLMATEDITKTINAEAEKLASGILSFVATARDYWRITNDFLRELSIYVNAIVTVLGDKIKGFSDRVKMTVENGKRAYDAATYIPRLLNPL